MSEIGQIKCADNQNGEQHELVMGVQISNNVSMIDLKMIAVSPIS
jgi:hypothetical protein